MGAVLFPCGRAYPLPPTRRCAGLRAGDVTVTNTALWLEAGDYTARIAFRDDRTIAGLHIVDAKTS